jgi:hypothetical protein
MRGPLPRTSAAILSLLDIDATALHTGTALRAADQRTRSQRKPVQITAPDNFPGPPRSAPATKDPGQRVCAPPVGLEPTTRCLEGSRSIHLSYGGLAQGQR